MLESAKYVVRCLAAIMLILMALVLSIFAATANESRGIGFGMAGLFGLAGLFTWPRRPNAWRRDPPTDRQVAYAKDLGIVVRRGMSKGELSDLISEAKALR